MAVLVHRSVTNSQAIALAGSPAMTLPARFGGPTGPSLFARTGRTLRLWRRRIRERQELALLPERDLRDMGALYADVWHETNQWFWRASRPL
ncbi:MAG TPA: DUF1127 domain-containing protein [Terracidiphilus sp.]|jgi:uncharacterized protein YjiS (DUF1127 family)|nr:DUF1127 domain-containing protein [Terracidiphilus sp.]HUB49359.1 DUF1127 domain-containing protein [Acetobacteraceae bacterium]